jgi:hypothetical protein
VIPILGPGQGNEFAKLPVLQPGGCYEMGAEVVHSETEDINLFLTLGKYVRRQQENLLTQSFVALFNHSLAFRRRFLATVQKQGVMLTLDAERLWARTQQARSLGSERRLIVDAEILPGTPGRTSVRPAALLEAKLSVPLGPKQAGNYVRLLKKRKAQRRAVTMVFLTKYGLEGEIASRFPRQSTVWLTWSEMGALPRHDRRLSSMDRFLWKEFSKMLEFNGIPMLPCVSRAAWKKLRLLNRFALGNEFTRLHADVIATLKAVIDCAVVHRDSEWGGLAKQGWKPYSRVFAERDENSEASVFAKIGFFKRCSRGRFRQGEICICVRV